jgi:predicted flap endonuclease-1-like 5' DNA nuclease
VAKSVPFRRKLTETESICAFVAGGGVVLIMLAFLMTSARVGGIDPGNRWLNLLMFIGVLLLLAGVAGWLTLTRPWTKFDDWKTPLFTGHEDAEEHAEGHEVEAHAAHVEPAHEAAVAAPARAVGSDDLSQIDGIGPKIAGALRGAGISTFADLASREPEQIERVVRAAGVRMIGHADSWVKQAKTALEKHQQAEGKSTHQA